MLMYVSENVLDAWRASAPAVQVIHVAGRAAVTSASNGVV